ncbi:FAD-binding protein [Humitalea sp. 24SJ18S-53]|uniref:FAD-binding protein n=1 Tax=Humitalea sp. 24SJ18S-53 TaxID=3422307 RepID=UPI003D675D29
MDVIHLSTEVLVIGAGGAGMYAALEAAKRGARVLLLDRSLIGRGGATVMAQMTVAAAVAPDGEDDWRFHLADTLAAGRGLCDPRLAALLCEEGAECILEMEKWKVGWARDGARLRQVQAPGHDRARCVYVDFLNTGPAVSRTLRTQVQRAGEAIERVGEVAVTDLVLQDGVVTGAVGVHVTTGRPVSIAATATIVATGGLTRLYARNSAAVNMSGDGYALALRAGASLIDMEFVQFFPIGHLAPRLVGMDPIMWDPFRYKLGGRLLNGAMEEFVARWGGEDGGRYVATRDLVTYAITKEVQAGRGSPAGGAWLSFAHLDEAALRGAFGPVIDKLAANGIDLTRDAVEVAPIAHYHMGGVRVDVRMRTGVPGLLAAGEAVGGANGANRLSGNAITEAFAFGRAAGREAAAMVARGGSPAFDTDAATGALALLRGAGGEGANPAALLAELQRVMGQHAGPFRTAQSLRLAEQGIAAVRAAMGSVPPGAPGHGHDLLRLDWFDLRQMLLVADCVVTAGLARQESRGAHQREDFPDTDEAWTLNQVIDLDAATGRLVLSRAAVPVDAEAAA